MHPVAAAGMCVAKVNAVQVQLTEFETDTYSLSIQDQRDFPMTTNDILVSVHATAGSKSKLNVSFGRAARAERRSDEKVQRLSGQVIGANTLSIIGQIEPGRTVRLYRQIH